MRFTPGTTMALTIAVRRLLEAAGDGGDALAEATGGLDVAGGDFGGRCVGRTLHHQADRTAQAIDVVARRCVITSYSIHYTKLYD